MPKKLLTDAAIKRLSTPPKTDDGKHRQIDYWDQKERGLVLRLSSGGSRVWYSVLDVPTGGTVKSRRTKIGAYPVMSLADARDELLRHKKLIASGIDPKHEKAIRQADAMEASTRTFGSCADEYLNRRKGQVRPKTLEEYRRAFKVYFADWAALPLDRISTRMIDAEFTRIATKHGGISSNRARAALSVFLNWCADTDHLSTLPRIPPKYAKEQKRQRVLTAGELASVWRVADSWADVYGAWVKAMILTGQRESEVAQMRWSDIDEGPAGLTWTIPNAMTKNGTPHRVPLSRGVVEVLEGLPRIADCPFVFPSSRLTAITGFNWIKRRIDADSGITEPWVIHDLRRTFASFAASELDARLEVVEAILNHKSGVSGGLVAVYQVSDYAEQKRNVLDRWADKVRAITGGDGNTSQGTVVKLHG